MACDSVMFDHFRNNDSIDHYHCMGAQSIHLCGMQVVVITKALHSLVVVVFTLQSSRPSSQTSSTTQAKCKPLCSHSF